MKSYKLTLTLQSAFATPLKGDTLFGQLCWAIRNRLGEDTLTDCLAGYTKAQPFAVVSDAFPEGYFPLPKLPSCFYELPEDQDRKAIKKRTWLPEAAFQQPINQWLKLAVTAKALVNVTDSKPATQLSEKHPHAHNTINRQTNTTGDGGFAPYSVEQEWFVPGVRWSIYLLLDINRLSVEDCQQCLDDMGAFGFGKDASIGLGKFSIDAFQEYTLPAQASANACLTLAPCAPQGLGFDSQHSYYQLFTRFGRHGDIAVHQEGKPFKNPLLLAQTGAVFKTTPSQSGFIGQGVGGQGELSKTLATTIHQGYAPVLAINFNASVNS